MRTTLPPVNPGSNRRSAGRPSSNNLQSPPTAATNRVTSSSRSRPAPASNLPSFTPPERHVNRPIPGRLTPTRRHEATPFPNTYLNRTTAPRTHTEAARWQLEEAREIVGGVIMPPLKQRGHYRADALTSDQRLCMWTMKANMVRTAAFVKIVCT